MHVSVRTCLQLVQQLQLQLCPHATHSIVPTPMRSFYIYTYNISKASWDEVLYKHVSNNAFSRLGRPSWCFGSRDPLCLVAHGAHNWQLPGCVFDTLLP